MSTLEDLDEMENQDRRNEGSDGENDGTHQPTKSIEEGEAQGSQKKKGDDDLIDAEILHSSTRDINMRRRLLENDMRIMKSEYQRLNHEQAAMKEKIKENLEKIENNR